MMRIPFRSVLGIEVTIDERGNFWAEIDGRAICFSRFTGLEQEILSRSVPIPAVLADPEMYELHHVNIVGEDFDNLSCWLTDQGESLPKSRVFLPDVDAAVKMAHLAARQMGLYEERNTLLASLRPLSKWDMQAGEQQNLAAGEEKKRS